MEGYKDDRETDRQINKFVFPTHCTDGNVVEISVLKDRDVHTPLRFEINLHLSRAA